MKSTTILWIIAVIALLAVSGCGEKEEKVVVSSETVTVEGESSSGTQSSADANDTEPQSVVDEEGVQDTSSDVTDDVKDEESMVNETDDESSVIYASGEDSSSDADDNETEAKTAQNFRVVSLKDLKAYPEEMTIKVGTTVEWRNVNDNLQHIIGWKGQSGDGIKPEPILQGESWSYTFNEPGVVKWFSTARPTIQGVITIEE